MEALQQFLDDPDSQCFVLNGYAGTGKTFLIGGLVRYLQCGNRKPEMMAPTGRAAHVIRERHRVDASTIHRHIYSLNTLKEFRELESYLREKRRIRTTSSTLIDVVRQVDSSLIVKNATRMRELLRKGRFPSFDFVANEDQVREVSPDDLVETFVRERISSLTPDMVIIAHTNPLTRTYNDAVRARLFPGVPSLTKGDQIIVVRNNYRYERPLMNGQMGQVLEVDGETEVRTVHLNIGTGKEEGGRQNVTVRLKFRMATLRFSDDREGHCDVPCKISEDCLLNADKNLPSEYSKALYVDFRNRNSHLKPSQPEFKEVLKADPYFSTCEHAGSKP